MTTEETPSAQSEATSPAQREAASSEQNEAASSAQIEAMGNRVEAVEREIVALTAAQSAARKTRLLLPLGFLVFVCVFCFLFNRLREDTLKQENLDEIRALAQKRLEGNFLDQVKRQVETFVETAKPELTKAFREQAEKDMPKYTAALTKEREALVESLQERLQEQLNKHYKTILENHRAIIKQEYPDLTDAQLGQMTINLQKAAEQLVEKYYVEEMRGALEEIFATWDSFPIADPPASTELPLEEQLVGYFLEIVKAKLSGSQTSLLEGDATD